MSGIEEQPADVERYLEELAQHGRHPGGGWFRPVYSPDWQAAQRQILDWFDRIGLESRVDAVGTVYGRLAGSEGGDCIVTGSHFDTVLHGGKFDGAAGVVAAMAAVHTLKERFGAPRRTLEVVGLCEEEGSRYHANMWGSRAITGRLFPDDFERLVDSDGVRIGDAMRAVGLDPDRIGEAQRDDVAAFLELHVEQGHILQAEGIQIGVVDVVTGITTLKVTLRGRSDHAGTTPMTMRRDSFLGAAAMTLALTDVALELGRPAVLTVGSIAVKPNVRNIVAGETVFLIDARHSVPARKEELVSRAIAICQEIGARRDLEVEIEQLTDKTPAPMDSDLVRVLEDSAAACGYSYQRMVSGAGHDAQTFSYRFPAVMLFVPSKDGRSHSPLEYTSLEDLTRGVSVLATALHQLAY
ncbi:MAG: Zn-dependent hydrolase [Chloroflexi bacterium]|nr:Zn-dependent hydrolase [Chloroflexota bacterium]